MMEATQIAVVCHEANRAVRRLLGESDDGGWEDVSSETRLSAIDGVLVVQAGATPQQSHENWLAFKTKHGWVYGSEKDEKAKTHPCIVDYDDLPHEQQLKDHLFTAIVLALS